MTVGELEDFIAWYKGQKGCSESDAVVLVDDGMKPRYFDAKLAFGSIFDRRIKDAVIEYSTEPHDGKDVVVPRQVVPPEYRPENILLLTFDSTRNVS